MNCLSSSFNQISSRFHFFPDDWDHDEPGRPSNPALYPDLMIPSDSRQCLLRMKRAMDIAGSLLALAVSLPLFAASLWRSS